MESQENEEERRKETWIRNHTCKQCKKYPRANGSSRCQACTAEFHIINEQERKLQRKVEAQVKINK